MTEQEMEEIMKEYGYDIHFHSGDYKRFNYSKWFNRRGQASKGSEDMYVSIGLGIDVEEDTFEFIYVAKAYFFKFSSGTMRSLKRDDFFRIEQSFVQHCISLQNTNW